MMVFITGWVLELSPNFPQCQGAYISQNGGKSQSRFSLPSSTALLGVWGSLWLSTG